MLILQKTEKPLGNKNFIGSVYVSNGYVSVWRMKFSEQLYFKENNKPETEGWYVLQEEKPN